MKKIFFLFIIAFLLSACAKGKYATNKLAKKNNKMNNVLEEQAFGPNHQVNVNMDKIKIKSDIKPDKSVDYDLTVMDADMVYASIYQLMVNPNPYVGKSFKMEGIYYSTFYEPTKKYYHYIIIEDALACCAQGIEFIWGDGSHIYPDEYPQNESRIEIKGKFETYKENNDDRLYCRIIDADMKSTSK